MTDETIIKRIESGIFHNNPDNFGKVLWRMARGSRAKAFQIVRELAVKHYGITDADLHEHHIDDALANLNGGCEVEWAASFPGTAKDEA